MSSVIWFAAGITIGCLLHHLKRPQGTLKIDHSNPEKDSWLFDLGDNLDKIPNKKRIVLAVDNNAKLSQK